MGYQFHTNGKQSCSIPDEPYRAKEGRIIRILQGTGRISINLIEYEVSAHQIIIIPDNSLIELLEISPDYDFQVIVPACNFLPACPVLSCRKLTRETVSYCHLMRKNGHRQRCFLPCCGIYSIPRPTVVKPYQHFIISLLYNLKYTYEQTRTTTPLRLSAPGRNIPPFHSPCKRT